MRRWPFALMIALLASVGVALDPDAAALRVLVSRHRELRASCLAGGVPSAASCRTEPRHALHVKRFDGAPNEWNTAVFAPPHPGGRELRHVRKADGSFKHLHLFSAFTGVVEHGFIDHYSSTILRNSSVLVDDFFPELMGASFACRALTGADGSAADEHTRPFKLSAAGALVRNPVLVDVAFAAPAPEAAAAAAGGMALLEARFVAGNDLSFGGRLLTEHTDFDYGTGCGSQIVYEAPFYHIAAAAWSAEEAAEGGSRRRRLRLALLPTNFHDLHLHIDVKHSFNPNVTEELATRTAEGRSLGDAEALAKFRARRLTTSFTHNILSFGVNWNQQSGVAAGAATHTIEVFKGLPGVLQCVNCYAYASLSVTMNLAMCMEVGYLRPGSSGAYAFNYIDDTVLVTSSPALSAYPNPSPFSSYPPGSTSCENVVVPQHGWGLYQFQGAFRVDAFVTGSVGYAYNLVQNPTSGPASTCASKAPFTAATAEDCSVVAVPYGAEPGVVVTIASPPITLNVFMQIRIAAQVRGAYDGALNFGRSYSATAKLGSVISIPTLYDNNGNLAIFTPGGKGMSITPYTTFTSSSALLPTRIKFPTNVTIHPEAFLYMDVLVKLWDSIPIIGTVRLHATAAFAMGTGAAVTAALAGSPAAGTSVALGYTSGPSTTPLLFGAASCPVTAHSVATAFVSANLGIDVAAGILDMTLYTITPLQTAVYAYASYVDLGTAMNSVLQSIQILIKYVTPYVNILGSGNASSTLNMFSACVGSSSATSQRRELQVAAVVYGFDDSNTYPGHASAASTGGATTGAVVGITSGAILGIVLISTAVLNFVFKRPLMAMPCMRMAGGGRAAPEPSTVENPIAQQAAAVQVVEFGSAPRRP